MSNSEFHSRTRTSGLRRNKIREVLTVAFGAIGFGLLLLLLDWAFGCLGRVMG